MKNYKLTFILVLAIQFSAFAQQALSVTGGDATGVGGSSSFTVGQVAFNFWEGSTATLSEGIQQPIENYTLSVNDLETTFSLSIYPNPASDHLTINFDNMIEKKYNYKLFDLNGKLILKDQITSNQTLLDLKPFASSIYLLNLYKSNIKLQSFKILKN
ncbi:T9SS type A sorting domain-containing protein [Psychroflexus montanilacus]|uniref:T9SS type A sorting domain-containing protein n=1 Tax=Psychroflexus montanilacus TaxID=2873598 RepID=UPI001CCF9659|nr:T9SS type A sorting domain-containing protein [Psychroflexus montanilacus]MBZ9650628.1 T9SS type A sorting domain-containing protein [Psychroflexus montanilacus]